jgi:hypothetical protein
MFRRRPARTEAPAAAPRPASLVTAAGLTASGWVVPKGITAGHEGSDATSTTDPRWTLIGTVGSPTATPVDPAGLLVGEGWSIDWWLGADDRWHHPAR